MPRDKQQVSVHDAILIAEALNALDLWNLAVLR